MPIEPGYHKQAQSYKPVGYESYCTVAELAALVNVHKDTVRNWQRTGRIPAPLVVTGPRGVVKLWDHRQVGVIIQRLARGEL